MIGRLGIAAGSVCLAWVMTGISGLGENSKQNQAAGTRTEPFLKALFLKLQYAMAAGC